jgi:hypothetical protein
MILLINAELAFEDFLLRMVDARREKAGHI